MCAQLNQLNQRFDCAPQLTRVIHWVMCMLVICFLGVTCATSGVLLGGGSPFWILAWLLVVPLCFLVPHWAKAWGGWARLGTLLEQTDARVLGGLGAIVVIGVTLSLLETGWLRLAIFTCLSAGLGAVLSYIVLNSEEAVLRMGNQEPPLSVQNRGDPGGTKYQRSFFASLFLDSAMSVALAKPGSEEDRDYWPSQCGSIQVLTAVTRLLLPGQRKRRCGSALQLGRTLVKKFRPDLRLVQFLGRGGQHVVTGEASVVFRPQQQVGSVHIAFWPPFESVPQVRFWGGGRARVKLGKVYPFGMRLDVRLSSPAPTQMRIPVRFRATLRGQNNSALDKLSDRTAHES